jgi:FHA domain-containing protein
VASAASVPAPASVDPFADLLGPSGGAGASASDPFADLLGPATPAAAPVRPASIPTAASLGSPTVAPGPAARLPDDFDPFADLAPPPRGPAGLDAFMTGTPAAPPPPAGALPADLGLGDLIGNPASGTPGASGGSLDTLFGLNKTSATSSDPLAAFMAAPAPAKDGAPASPASTDPLAFFGAAPAAEPAPALPADFDHTPELKGAYVPPAVQAPAPARLPAAEQTQFAPPQAAAAPARVPEPPTVAPAPRPSAGDILPATTMPAVRPAKAAPASDAPMTAGLGAPAPAVPAAPAPVTAGLSTPVTPAVPAAPATAPAAPHANAEPLWAAFCEGAGIKLTPPQGLNPELMRMIGQILAQSMDGTLKLMAVRATAKQEMRAQVTTIQSRNNNPLKFSPDAGAAIEQLLQPPMRGFMFGPAAVTEAMDDLLGHAIGTMAGMRAALEGVLKRFEPSQLEGKLSSGGVFDALLPMNRRAKLWELYLQHYERIHGEAQDDFHDLFGKAFIKAYEDQLDLLDEARNQNK